MFDPTTANCDEYLASREGQETIRATRYKATCNWLRNAGLSNSDTLLDLGAGMTELDYYLRTELGWKGRYIPIDGGIDEKNHRITQYWNPPREVDWIVSLEFLEHIYQPHTLLQNMFGWADKGIVFSTPNPWACDVKAMDETHVSEIDRNVATALGYEIHDMTFYAGYYNKPGFEGKHDALFGTWRRQ